MSVDPDAPRDLRRVLERRDARRLLEVRQDAELHALRFWNHWDNERRLTGGLLPYVALPPPQFDPDELAVLRDRALVRLLDARADATLRHRTDDAGGQWRLLLGLIALGHARRITACRAPFAHNRVVHLWRTRYLVTP